MAKLIRAAQAGTVESTDILINLVPAPAGTGLNVNLTSPVMQQYGEHIIALIKSELAAQQIVDADVHANERGALDYTIQARMKTAIARAMKREEE